MQHYGMPQKGEKTKALDLMIAIGTGPKNDMSKGKMPMDKMSKDSMNQPMDESMDNTEDMSEPDMCSHCDAPMVCKGCDMPASDCSCD